MEAVVGGGVDAGDGGELGVERGMEVQQRHDGCGLEEMELDVVLGLDEHRVLSPDRDRWDTPILERDTDSKETRGHW